MDIHRKILRDLQAGPSTADSLAPRVQLTTTQTIAALVWLKRQGLVDSRPLAGITQLHVYHLVRL